MLLLATAGMLLPAPRKFATARRFGLAVALHLCVAFGSVGPATAWGNVAHRAIALLAEQQLTPEAPKEVRRLLALEGADRMADVVMWADQIRRMQVPGSPDHEAPIPFDAEGYDAERDCQSYWIVGAIPFYLEILADRTKPDAERLEALK